MTAKFQFKKWGRENDPTQCETCPNKTLYYVINRRTGEESWGCLECAIKIYKIKKLKRFLRKYPLRQKKAKIPQISPLKNAENRDVGQMEVSNSG